MRAEFNSINSIFAFKIQHFIMLDYTLADKELLNSSDPNGFMLFIPDKPYVVLGRSNKISSSVNTENTEADKIKIIRRPSGGESVFLSPKMLIISIKMAIVKGEKPDFYFRKANGLITDCLIQQGVENIHSKGISDLSIGNKKILGSSIYRNNNSMFYHAVLNINEDINLITKYLKHPKREPHYRQGRIHSSFVTSLEKEGYMINGISILQCIENHLRTTFFVTFVP